MKIKEEKQNENNLEKELLTRKESQTENKEIKSSNNSIQNITQLLGTKFWEEANWIDIVCEVLFHIKRRNTTIYYEIYAGIVQFISCMYVLPVIPEQMINAGYKPDSSYVVTASMCGIGCILGGLFANLPFIIAPPTAISIFLSIFLQQNGFDTSVGNQAVVASGIGLIFLGYRPLSRFLSRLIPYSIQVGTAIGIGLLTALAGATDIDLVVTGHYTVVKLGKITPEVMVAIAGSIIIGIALHHHIKGAFCLALCFGTIVWWSYDDSWPHSIASMPSYSLFDGFTKHDIQHVILLTCDLLFLYILTLNGLVSSLSSLAGLMRPDNTTPRNRWLYVVCGVCTCISGLLSGPPILVSPESASGIKGGAKTGLSTIVCGLLFALSIFFDPLFRHVPSAATAPLLIGVGVILFQNVQKLNWINISESMPAYFVLFFIPFTYSILQGVAIGYVVYLILGVFTGQIFYSGLELWIFYFGVPFKKWNLQQKSAQDSKQLVRVFSHESLPEQVLSRGSTEPDGRRSITSPRPTSPNDDRIEYQHLPHHHPDDGLILNPGIAESYHPITHLPFFPNEEGFQQYTEARERALSQPSLPPNYREHRSNSQIVMRVESVLSDDKTSP